MFSQRRPKIISIEGNIGAGKTTIVENMQNRLASDRIIFLREPVDIWEKIKEKTTGENILVKFYKNPEKYSFAFQIMAFITRVSMLREAIDNNPNCEVIICERSLDADRNIFAKMLRDDGKIDDVQFQIYEKVYDEYVCANKYELDGIVFIDASPSVCKRRIFKREREGEDGISIEYLTKCSEYHKKWLVEGDDLGRGSILHINTDEDVTYDENDNSDLGNKWMMDIYDFVSTVCKK